MTTQYKQERPSQNAPQIKPSFPLYNIELFTKGHIRPSGSVIV